MTKKRATLIACILLLLCSCERYDIYYSSMFVSHYSNIASIHLSTEGGDCNVLQIGISDTYYASIADDDRTVINQLAEKHNDTSYNKKIAYMEGANWTVEGCTGWKQDFVRIDILSDADYDETHKAGTLLNDIVRLCSATPYPYIMSGYTKTFDWSTTEYTARPECHLIDGLLSELRPEDLIMAGWPSSTCYAELRFVKQPTLSKQHRFSLEMESDDGHVYRSSLKVEFE